jgi:hypothetical protein
VLLNSRSDGTVGPEGNGPEGNGPEGNGPEGNGPEGNGPASSQSRSVASLDRGPVLEEGTYSKFSPELGLWWPGDVCFHGQHHGLQSIFQKV